MKYETWYRLPYGDKPGAPKYTKKSEEYVQAWRKLGRQATKIFPGYEMSGVDPHVTLHKYGKTPDGRDLVLDSLQLSVGAVRAAVGARRKKVRK